MRGYDYMHEGLIEAPSAVPGKRYDVLRTNQKLQGITQGWLATKLVIKTDSGNARAFVQEDGSVAYLDRNTVLR